MSTIVNIGALLDAIKRKHCAGIYDAAALCGVGAGSLKKLMRGELPRLDALFRICNGLDINVKEVVSATTLKAAAGARVVLPGRWQSEKIARHQR